MPAELPRYPGVPQGVEPKAGKSLGAKLDDLINLVRSCPDGNELTQRETGEVINHPVVPQDVRIGGVPVRERVGAVPASR